MRQLIKHYYKTYVPSVTSATLSPPPGSAISVRRSKSSNLPTSAIFQELDKIKWYTFGGARYHQYMRGIHLKEGSSYIPKIRHFMFRSDFIHLLHSAASLQKRTDVSIFRIIIPTVIPGDKSISSVKKAFVFHNYEPLIQWLVSNDRLSILDTPFKEGTVILKTPSSQLINAPRGQPELLETSYTVDSVNIGTAPLPMARVELTGGAHSCKRNTPSRPKKNIKK